MQAKTAEGNGLDHRNPFRPPRPPPASIDPQKIRSNSSRPHPPPHPPKSNQKSIEADVGGALRWVGNAVLNSPPPPLLQSRRLRVVCCGRIYWRPRLVQVARRRVMVRLGVISALCRTHSEGQHLGLPRGWLDTSEPTLMLHVVVLHLAALDTLYGRRRNRVVLHHVGGHARRDVPGHVLLVGRG